ncbi:MAG TPA: glycosyltransferase family 1 protein [Flavitalea sp.]|nr:glycosyltransferase family 1 protein [Flavitalea sp.]
MKIGIDAKWYFTGPVSTQTVLQNLLPRLFELYPMHEWVIYLDEKDKGLDFPFKQPNITRKYVWANNNMLSNLFLLPTDAGKEAVDVLVFQTFPPIVHIVPSIAFIHDVLFRDFPQFFTWKERLYFLPLSWLTRKASRLIATTDYVASNLIKHKYARTKSVIDIVPLAAASEFKPLERHDADILRKVKEKYRLPDKYLLFVGRLNVRKNIENLLKALLLMQSNYIPLIIIGKEDWKTPNLQNLLSHQDLKNRIFIQPNMNNEELAATYAMSTVFCFPSFAEGFGLPPLEAMASGIPVIVSKTTGLKEVCGPAAVFIDPSNAASIAKALDKLLNDAVYYNDKRLLGLKQAAQYNWTESAHAFMQSITNALKKTSS